MSDAVRKSVELDAHERLASGAVWRQFCNELAEAGEEMLSSVDGGSVLDIAEGHRYLTRLLRGAFETYIEFGDPRAPVLRRTCHETIKMGADNPDNHYYYASLNGKYSYRVYGSRGTVHYLGFGTQAGNYGKTGNLAPTGYIDDRQLQVDEQGNFELVVSVEEQGGNWLPMTADTRSLNVRQSFLDRRREVPAELYIECLSDDSPPRPLSSSVMERGLIGSAKFVKGTVRIFREWVKGFEKAPNQLPPFDSAVANDAGGVANIAYYHGYWQLEQNEALVIEATPPACDYWNFQLNNIWMESLDYRYFPITLNKSSATCQDDGSVRIVVAHADPGVPNWIDTCGHDRGTMCWRWVRAETHSTSPNPCGQTERVVSEGRADR